MKRFYRLVIFAISWGAVTSSYSQEQASASFTLEQCIEYALENNPNLKNSKSAVSSSEARIRETVSLGLPQINAGADLANNVIIPTSFLPAQVFGGPAGEFIGVRFGTQYSGRATINVDQMLFSGSYFVGLKASRVYSELSRQDLVNTKTDLIIAIKKAYYSVLVNQERLDLVKKNYARLDSLLKQTKTMYQNGFSEKIDVSRLQVQFNNIINLQRTTELGLSISYNLLKFQMGLNMLTKLTLSDNLETIKVQALEDSFAQDFSYFNRPEFKKLEVNQQLVKLDMKNTKVQYLPSLDLYGNYGISYGSSDLGQFLEFGSRWKSLGTIGLRANLPIFDGFRKSNQIQQKKIQYSQLENTKTLLKNQIDMEQDQAMASFKSNVEALRSQKENLELADEVYKVSVIKYQQGVGSNIEVINADASLKEAQTSYYASLYDALISSVDLDKAFGKILTNQNTKK